MEQGYLDAKNKQACIINESFGIDGIDVLMDSRGRERHSLSIADIRSFARWLRHTHTRADRVVSCRYGSVDLVQDCTRADLLLRCCSRRDAMGSTAVVSGTLTRMNEVVDR
mgnify:FL=1